MPDNDLFRRYLDAGVAFTQLTRQRAESIVKDLVQAGEVSREQATARVEELLERSRQNTDAVLSLVRKEIDDRVAQLNLVTRDDVNNLLGRLGISTGAVRRSARKAGARASGAAKRTTAKTGAANKTVSRKTAAKKTAASKTAASKTAARKTAAKKTPATKATAKKAGAAKKTAARKATTARKTVKKAAATPSGSSSSS